MQQSRVSVEAEEWSEDCPALFLYLHDGDTFPRTDCSVLWHLRCNANWVTPRRQYGTAVFFGSLDAKCVTPNSP